MVAYALSLVLPPLGVLVGLVYLAVADGIQNGQSLGKMVVGLEVVDEEGNPCDIKASIYRNIPFVLFFFFPVLHVLGLILLVLVGLPLLLIELWLVVVDDTGERLGDRVAGTRVVLKGRL
jgi:uncharacterized RDD family membrane protein YckC